MAIDRSHDMDDDMPFLLPVIVDDTPDATARAPERFRERQWTRLTGGEAPAAFAERVKRLLGGDVAPVSDRRLEAKEVADAGRRPALLPKRSTSRRWLLPTIIGGALIAGLVIWQPWRKPASTARQLVAQAWAAFEKPDHRTSSGNGRPARGGPGGLERRLAGAHVAAALGFNPRRGASG